MTIFRRLSARTSPPQEMPPRPSVLNRQAPDPVWRGAWMTEAPLRREFDPCGAPPLARASSTSGETA